MARQPLGTAGALSGVAAMLVPFLLLLITLLPTTALAQRPEPTIYNSSATKYVYAGCYNETTGISGTAGDRALDGGIHMIGTGNMTVPMCLDFCDSGSYAYAGIEYSRECWCAQHISGLSVKFADAECDLGCDGNQTQTCGGALKLTVYTRGGAASMKALSGVLVLFLAAATAFNLF